MSQYWFKAKKYGWGISWPIAWQGWAAFLCLIIFILVFAYVDNLFSEKSHITLKDFLRFFLDTLMLSILFCLMLNEKVENGLKWRWGKE